MPASASYLNPDELTTYYDSRRVLQLASDTGTPAVAADLDDDGSAAYAFVNAAIRSAAAELDSHCQQGKRYTRADLEAIITAAVAAPSDEAKNKRAGLIRQLVADLAFGVLASRRGYHDDRLKALAPRYETALVTLERLSQGFQVFDLDDAINAGVPSRVRIGLRNYRPATHNRLFGAFEDTRGPSPYDPWNRY